VALMRPRIRNSYFGAPIVMRMAGGRVTAHHPAG
jgi:hypothetical protein